jgi:hypothetical protein
MKRIRMRGWVFDFVSVFLIAISVQSLRRLHAVGQPILEMVIDTFGISAMYAFLAYFLLDRQTPHSD